MSDTSIYVSYAIFKQFSADTNGGVFCIDKDIYTTVFSCSFTLCNVGNKNGACIYYASSKTLFSSNNCISSCIACNGQFISSAGPSSYSSLELNRTATTDCSGTGRAVVYLINTNILSRTYNSSKCISGVHCNVGVHECARSDSSFYYFISNPNDILYNVNAGGTSHLFSHICFINNTLNHGQNGYIHFNSPTTAVLTVDNLFASGNTNKLIDAHQGTVIVKHFTGDAFTRTGGGFLTQEVIDERENYVLTFIMELKCEINGNIMTMKGGRRITCNIARIKNQLIKNELIFFITSLTV